MNRQSSSARGRASLPQQMPLFALAAEDPPVDAAPSRVGAVPDPEPSAAAVMVGRVPVNPVVNPHLLAARRLARKIRRLPERSAEETRAGLAICRQLKAYLQEDTAANSPRSMSRQPF